MPFDDDGSPVNQPEFILEPNALITGSEYFRTAFEDKFESVSPIVCGNALVEANKETIKISEIVFEILFINLVKNISVIQL
jgi:hypothetical protein